MNNNRFRFRAWDWGNKCWVDDEEKLLAIIRYHLHDIHKISDGDDWCVDYTLIQCTGLKDSEGKLIWEGDVVLVPDLYVEPVLDYGQGTVVPFNHIVSIEYRDGEFGFDLGEDYEEHGWWSWSYWKREMDGTDNIKIIGNIYENPELING